MSPETGSWGNVLPLAQARAELLAAAPDASTAAEVDAYVLRLASGCLSDAFLPHLLLENGLYRVMPTRGGPNPDYLMWQASLDPSRHYVLQGQLHDSERLGIGVYASTAAGLELTAYQAMDAAQLGPDRSFQLDLAPAAVPPRGLPLSPKSRVLLIRCLHRHPQGRPCVLTLSAGSAVPPPTLSIETETALARAGATLLRSARQFLRWSQETSAQPNVLAPPPTSIAAEVQGDPETVYYLGYYALDAQHWLEVLMPEHLSGYWSVYAYTHWLEALPGAGVHDRSAREDADGRIRLRIGPAVPSDVHNRIDTQGRHRGVLIFRSLSGGPVACPTTRLCEH